MKTFYLKQAIFGIKDRYKVYNENKEVVYNMKGLVFSLRGKVKIYETANKRHIYTLSRKLISFLPTYYLTEPKGKKVAKIKKRLTFLNHKITIESEIGSFEVRGNYYAYNFEVYCGEEEVLAVRKKIVAIGDSYEIVIFDEEKAEFFLALVLMLDKVFHRRNNRNK